MNPEYLKEKIRVELEFFKLYMIVVIALAGGIVSIALKYINESSIGLLFFISLGLFFLSLFIIGVLNSFIQIKRHLKELKKLKICLLSLQCRYLVLS